ARVWGGSTPGPSTVGFRSDEYTADESSRTVFLVANRENGHLGPVTVRVTSSDIPQGSGAATATQDYGVLGANVLWPTARLSDNFSRQLSESYRGPNSSEYFVTDQQPGTVGLPGTNSMAPSLTSPLVVSIFDDNVAEGD